MQCSHHTCEGLPLIVVQQAPEGLGNDPSGGRQGCGSHVGGFQQHGSNEVHAFQQLQIDVHVEGHLSAPFQLLLLGCLVLVPVQKGMVPVRIDDNNNNNDVNQNACQPGLGACGASLMWSKSELSRRLVLSDTLIHRATAPTR